MDKLKLISFTVIVAAVLNIMIVGSISHIYVLYQSHGMSAPNELINLISTSPGEIITGLFSAPVSDIYLNNRVQGIYWLVVLLAVVFQALKRRKGFSKENADKYGSHGTARLATPGEIKKLHNKEGMIVGEYKKKPLIQPIDGKNNHMTLIYGGSGSGKTAGYSIPNVLHISETLKESFVITDPKGDIFKATRNHLQQQGYDVLTVNLIDMQRSDRYNPLDYIHKANDSMSLATTIIKNTSGENKSGDSMWEHAEHALLSALIQFLKETRPKREQHFKNVLHLGNMIRKKPKEIDDLFNELPDNSTAKHLYNIFANSEDKTRTGILIGFASRLRLWALEDLSSLTATSDFNINQLGQKKTALFIITPDSESTFDMITAILIDQVFQELIKQATENDSKHLNVPVRMILDEVANIAPISDLQKRVAVMRSRGVRITLMFQGVQQFKNRYGEGQAAEISDSCDNTILMAANDSSTSVPMSNKLGKTTLMISSQSHSSNDRGESSGFNYSFTGRELMTPDELENMPDNKCVLFQKGKYPAYIDKHFYFKQKKWNIIPYDWTNIPKKTFSEVILFNPEGNSKEEVKPDEEELLFN